MKNLLIILTSYFLLVSNLALASSATRQTVGSIKRFNSLGQASFASKGDYRTVTFEMNDDVTSECNRARFHLHVYDDDHPNWRTNLTYSLLKIAYATERRLVVTATGWCERDKESDIVVDSIEVKKEGAGRGLTVLERQAYTPEPPPPPPPVVPPTVYRNVSSFSSLGVCPSGTYATGCISGERRVPEAAGLTYRWGTWGGYSVPGNQLWSYRGNLFCYYGGQKQDYDGTDLLVGFKCAPSGSRMTVHVKPYEERYNER